jgi:uncharacterized protein (TIGR03000 family)
MTLKFLRTMPAVVAALLFLNGLGFAQEKKLATITIILPENLHKNAEVRIEDVLTKQTGAKRKFQTPPLETGKNYVYTIKAVIEPNNYTKIFRTREVNFKAGDEITLDLRKADPAIKDDVQIRFVPTPEDIAEEMCKLAKIGKEDIVYDCGCGDGMLILTAVKKFNAKKAVGIDIDPTRVKEATANVAKDNLKDKIEIREGNALKQDKKSIGDATVIMTYMGNDLNILFRPILWESLKPGSRIVSHRFIMGDWKPEKTIEVKGADGDDYKLHLWTITGKEKDGKYEKTDKTDE